MKLTLRQRHLLQIMVDHRDDQAGELVRSSPGGWWLGLERVSGPTAFFLLRHCLVRKCALSDQSLEIYRATEYTRRALTEPDFSIFAEMAKGTQI